MPRLRHFRQLKRGEARSVWEAQHRLCSRYRRLMAKGKVRQKIATAIGRELLGFVWAIGRQVEKELADKKLHGRAA